MTQDKLNQVLKRYHREQKEFENHGLWKQLNTTPKEFFLGIQNYVERSGISKDEWQEKLSEARQILQTRLKEKQSNYQTLDFNKIKGLRV